MWRTTRSVTITEINTDSDTRRQLCAEYEVMNQIYINDELPQKDDLSNFLPLTSRLAMTTGNAAYLSFPVFVPMRRPKNLPMRLLKPQQKLMKNLKALLLKAMAESGPDILTLTNIKPSRSFCAACLNQ